MKAAALKPPTAAAKRTPRVPLEHDQSTYRYAPVPVDAHFVTKMLPNPDLVTGKLWGSASEHALPQRSRRMLAKTNGFYFGHVMGYDGVRW